MTTLRNNLLMFVVFSVFGLVPAFSSAATAVVQNVSPNATPMAKTNVSFSLSLSGFSVPIFQITDSFPNSTINSQNLNFGGNFSWVPVISDIGTHNITINVTDTNGNSATATQTITVLPPPSVTIQNVLPGATVMPNAVYSFTAQTPGFTNPQFFVSDSFSGSTVSNSNINSAGSFTWTPNASQNGDHAITVYASDSAGHNAQATVTVRVGAGPTLTIPSNISTTISPGQTLNFSLTPTGYTPTGFSISDKFTGQTSFTSNNVNLSGLVQWTPLPSDAGQHTVTFIGQVGAYGQSASTTLVINVLGPGGVLIPGPVTTVATTTASTSSGVSGLQAQLAALQAQLNGATTQTASGSGYVFTLYLKPGSENDEVMELQKLLSKLGLLKVAPNGYFGPSTEAAVKKFQAAKGLDQLGVVGPATRLELNTASGSSQANTITVTTTSSGKFVFNHFMGVGDDDDPDVMELQKKLVALGFLTAEPTGYYGAGTEAAVKKFQTKHGLPVTGYVAKNTRAVLNAQ